MDGIKSIFLENMKRLKGELEKSPVKGYFYMIFEKGDKYREMIGPERIDLLAEMQMDAEDFLPIHGTLKYMISSIMGNWSSDSKEPQTYTRLSKKEMVEEISRISGFQLCYVDDVIIKRKSPANSPGKVWHKARV